MTFLMLGDKNKDIKPAAWTVVTQYSALEPTAWNYTKGKKKSWKNKAVDYVY